MPSFHVDPAYASMSELVPGLYISGVCGLNPVDLNAARIGLIINATNEVPQMRHLGVELVKLWLEDTPRTRIDQHFDNVADRIEISLREHTPTLVHCVAGVSRSAALCLAFLVKYRCRSLRDAYHLMAAKRLLVRPNIGFWRQLIHYEQSLKKGRATVRLVRGGQPSIGDDGELEDIIPDVYLTEIIPDRGNEENGGDKENQFAMEGKLRKNSGGSKSKFIPILEPLIESEV